MFIWKVILIVFFKLTNNKIEFWVYSLWTLTRLDLSNQHHNTEQFHHPKKLPLDVPL